MDSKVVIRCQKSVIRIFVEKVQPIRLLPVLLKLNTFLLFCFLSTVTHAASDALSSSNKKSQRSTNVTSEDSSKYWVKAQPSKLAFFDRHAEGWHWYEPLRGSNQLSELPKAVFSNQKEKEEKAQTPTQIIEEQRKKLETKLHAAILEPNSDNIITYIIAQKALMDQSQRFSESWQRVVMTTPALDETLVHPVDQNARHVYYDEHHLKLQKHIAELAKDYGLFFFFRENCPYCHGFAPIVKRFSQKYGWSVLAVSLDGGSLPEFLHAKRDNGMMARLNITHVPALVALHPASGKLIPLAYGMISESEIEKRIELLTALGEKQ